MGTDAAERLRVYQEGQRSARSEDAECPYRYTDWRSGTWLKGRSAAMQHLKAMTLQAAVEESASIKVAEERHKKPLSATDIEIAIGYRLPQWSMELLLRLLQQRDEEVTRHPHAENERLRGIVPEVLERLNDELCDENEALPREREANLDTINVDNAIITRLSAQRDALLGVLRTIKDTKRLAREMQQQWCPAAQGMVRMASAAIKATEETATQPIERRNALSDDEVRDVLEAEFLGEEGPKRSWNDDLRVFRAADRAHHITSTEADSAPATKERSASHGLSPEVCLVLTQSRQALLGALGCYPLEHDKRPGAAQARSVLQEIDRLLKEAVDRDQNVPALTPEPVSVRLTLRTAEGRTGLGTLGDDGPMSWDRDGDDETVIALFEILQKNTDGRDLLRGGYKIDGDAWRELESQGDPELVLHAVRNEVPLALAVKSALEAARQSQQHPRER